MAYPLAPKRKDYSTDALFRKANERYVAKIERIGQLIGVPDISKSTAAAIKAYEDKIGVVYISTPEFPLRDDYFANSAGYQSALARFDQSALQVIKKVNSRISASPNNSSQNLSKAITAMQQEQAKQAKELAAKNIHSALGQIQTLEIGKTEKSEVVTTQDYPIIDGAPVSLPPTNPEELEITKDTNDSTDKKKKFLKYGLIAGGCLVALVAMILIFKKRK
ncbi:MAG: hypothetical protein M9916_00865 [Crocinitomicaceae bacterium]|nr:hypothetical protein [Crocinitomicaceae bacterium]